MTIIGGQWWWWRSLGVLGEGLGENKEEEDDSFTLLDIFEADLTINKSGIAILLK